MVRLTASQGDAGQLGTVAGVVFGITPTSVRVAGEDIGQASAKHRPRSSATVDGRSIDRGLITPLNTNSGHDVAVWVVSPAFPR